MFESFRAVGYPVLAIFAIGWLLGQIYYSIQKKTLTSSEDFTDIQSSFLKSNNGLLYLGMLAASLLLAGIYFGLWVRWLLLGADLLVLLIQVIKTGATHDFLREKLGADAGARQSLILIPLILKLSCWILSSLWIVYVFLIAGLI